jgi:nucleoside-diphosphate-sugar epimerase
VRELATMMLELAKNYPEYAEGLAKVKVVETTSGEYYGKGYQDVQNRVPKIANTQRDLEWTPRVTMAEALKGIFDYYRSQVADAQDLVN